MYNYRLFFLTGIAGAVYGVLLWANGFSPVAQKWHPEVMITLFLLSFATGFLLSAIPAMFDSFQVTRTEVVAALALYSGLWGAVFIDNMSLFVQFKLMFIALITLIVLVRAFARRGHLPMFIPFVILGLVMGLLSVIIQNASLHGAGMQHAVIDSRQMFYHGMFFMLFAGIGIRFFPVIFQSRIRSGSIKQKIAYSRIFWVIIALALSVTYIPSLFKSSEVLLWARVFIAIFIAFFGWNLTSKYKRGLSAHVLKVVLYVTLAGQVLVAMFPGQAVHLAHIIFITAFVMGLMLVATRVIAGHENMSFVVEKKSFVLFTAYILIFIAMATRATAHLIKSYELHLQMSMLLLVAGLSLWIAEVVRQGFYARRMSRAQYRFKEQASNYSRKTAFEKDSP